MKRKTLFDFVKPFLEAITSRGQNIRASLVISFCIIMLTSFVIVFNISLNFVNKLFDDNVKQQFNEVTTFYDEQINDQIGLQELILFGLTSNPVVIDAFQQQKGYQLILPTYQRLNKINNITHLYFINPQKQVVYRAHAPQRLGDTINRETLAVAVQTQKPTSGLEFGVLGTFTLRSVSPIYFNEKLLGYVEVGMEIGHVVKRTEKQFNINIYELFDKTLVRENSAKKLLNLTGRKSDWSSLDGFTVNYAKENQITDLTLSHLKSALQAENQSTLIIDDEALLNRKLNDFAGNSVGNLVIVSDVSTHNQSRYQILVNFTLTFIGVLLIGLFVFNIILKYVEKIITEYIEEKHNDARLLQQNIEQLKITQQAIIEKEKYVSLGNMVAGIAHEVNTPIGLGLTASTALNDAIKKLELKFNSETLKQSDLTKFISVGNESATLIENNLKRAGDLVHSFKQVAVDQSSDEERQVNFSQLIEEIVFSLRPLFKRTNHQIKIDCDESLEFKTVAGHWTQILINLITNSVKHGFSHRNDGTININVKVIGQDLTLYYTDDGSGIDEQHSDKIFEPFFTTKRNQGGSGLGMHLVYNLVTQGLKGNISMDKKHKQGVKFIIHKQL